MSPIKKPRSSTCEYNNAVPLHVKCVKAKIDTHWKNGTPLLCKKNKNVKRRETMACLPRRPSNSSSDDNEEKVFKDKSNFVTPKVLKNLNNLSDNFSRFFSLMEVSFKSATRDETDTAVIRQTVQEISDDFQKMNEIVDGLCRKTAKVTEFLLAKNTRSKPMSSV